MTTFLTVVHILICVVLVLVVLVQSGKDGGMGMMGGGSSQTVFGSSGGANFFTKFTSVLATVFMITSIFLTVTKTGKRTSVFAAPPTNAKQAIPSDNPLSKPGTGSTTTAPAAKNESPTAPAAPQKAPETVPAAPNKK